MLIQFAAKGITKRHEYKEAKERIRTIKKELMTLKKRKDKDIARIHKQKATIMNKIIESRKRIDKLLDDMEKATILELEKTCQRENSQMQEDNKIYTDLIFSLDALAGMLTVTKGDMDGEATIFIGTKRATEKIQEGERVVNFARHTTAADPIKYLPDGRIVGWLKSLRVLGTFTHQQKIYTGTFLERHDVSIADEFKDCDMFGSTLLDDGRLLLTDWDNKKVKLLDTSYKVVDQLVLLGHPDDVCSTNPQEAAVTLTMQKLIQFIKLVPKMYISRIIITEEHCRGIDYHDGQIYVACGGFKNEGDGKIVVYTVSGEHVKTIETNNFGQKIFTCPIAVTVVSDGRLIYVTDGKRGIVTLTSNNDVVSVISTKDVSWPCGMCVDRNDNPLICNARSSNVIQFCGFEKVAIVLTQKDGVRKPHSICYDPNNFRLIMTTHKSKFISVFQLSAPSVTQVAKGTHVKFDVVGKDNKTNDKSNKGDINNSGTTRAGISGPSVEMAKMSTSTELKKSEKSTNVITVRSSQSKGRTSDTSDQESIISTTGQGRANLLRGNLVGSRDKSTSRESVATNATDRKSDISSQITRGGGNRMNSARNSRMSGRFERKDSSLLNKSSRNGINRKNSIL